MDQIIEEQSQAAAEDGQQPQEQDGPTGPTKKDVGDDTRLKHRPMTSGERPTTEPYLKTRAFKRGQINKSW